MGSAGERALLRDLVGPLPSGVLGGLDRLAALAAKDADEPPDRVALPAHLLHDLRERRSLCTLQHRDDLELLVSPFGVLAAGRLVTAVFFAGFGRFLRLGGLRGLAFLAVLAAFVGSAAVGCTSPASD